MEQQTVQSDANTTASSAASAAPPASGQAVLDSMSDSQRSAWELTGDLPSSTPAADSSPAKPAEQAAATAASPSAASEPAKPADKGAKARSAELDTEITELRERLRIRAALREELGREQPRSDAQRPESSPAKAPTQAEYQRYMAMPDAPKEADFESFAEFTAATSLFITDQRWREHQTRAQQSAALERHVKGVEQISQTATERIAKATELDKEFASKVNPDLLKVDIASVRRLNGEKVGPQHVLAEQIATSEHVDKLLMHFSSTEGMAEWGRLCALPPAALYQAFGRLEARFESAGTPAPAAPTTKTLSTAPAPGTDLGRRPTEPIDPTEAALKRKDYAAYEAAENAKAMAAGGAR